MTANAPVRREAQTPSRFYALYDYRKRLRAAGTFKQLTQTAALLLLALTDYADPDGFCFPSVERLVSENPFSERSVQRGLREIQDAGLLLRMERPGNTPLYRIVMAAPPATLTPGGARMAGEGCHRGTLNKATITKQKTDQQAATHFQVAAASLATPSTEETPPKSDGGVLLAMEVPDDLAELARSRKGLSMIALRRLVGRHGQDVVRAAAAVVAKRYPSDSALRSGFGAVLTRALQEGWSAPAIEKASPKSVMVNGSKAAMPPEGTRWGRHKATGELRAVDGVSEGFVRFGGGYNAGVLPAVAWAEWEWLQENPGVNGRVEEDMLIQAAIEPSGDKMKNATLGRVAAWVAATRPAPGRLLERLVSNNLTFDDWEAFVAPHEQVTG